MKCTAFWYFFIYLFKKKKPKNQKPQKTANHKQLCYWSVLDMKNVVSSPVRKDEYGAALGVGISSPSKVWESSEVQPWMFARDPSQAWLGK